MKRKYGIFFLFLGLVLLICPSLSVNAAGKSMTLLKGETATFSAGSGYTYTSSAPSVVRVNQKTGRMKAKSGGKAVITAKSGKKRITRTVTVRDKVDIIVFAGQSNMTGVGNTALAPKLKDHAGYAYNYVTAKNKFSDLKEPFGRGQDDENLQNYDYARGSMVTAFVNAYYQKTKTPVIAVPASAVGTGSVSWADFRYKSVVTRVNAAKKLAQKKGLTVRHTYLIWMQGENDAFAGMSAKQHTSNLKSMYQKIKKKTKMEQCFIIGLPKYYNDPEIANGYTRIRNAQTRLCKSSSSFTMGSAKAATLSAAYLQGDGLHCSRSKFLSKLLKTFGKTFREIFPVFISTKRREKPSAFFDNNFVNNAYFSEAASSSSSHLASSSSKAPISSRMTCLCLWSS